MTLITREDERWKMKAIRFFGMSRTIYPLTRRHIPEYRNPWLHFCEKLQKSPKKKKDLRHRTPHITALSKGLSPILRPVQWSWQLDAFALRRISGRLIGSKSSANCRPHLWTAAYLSFFFFFGVSAGFWAVASQIPRFWDLSKRLTTYLDRISYRTRSVVKWACLCLHRDSSHVKTEDTGRVISKPGFVWQRLLPFKG